MKANDGRRKNKGTKGNKGGWKAGKYSPDYCPLLIAHLKEGLSIDSFGAQLNVSRTTVYNWVKDHPEFAEAKDIGTSHLFAFYEKMSRAMAIGQLEGNPTMAIWLTRNMLKWNNNDAVRVSGDADGAPLSVRSMTRQEVDARYAELAARAAAEHVSEHHK